MGSITDELAGLADYMQQRREAILQTWRDSVKRDRSLPSSDALPTRQLFDHIPAMLSKFEQELRATRVSDAAQSQASEEALAVAHGQERWQQGYDLREVVRELGTLNECVVAELDHFAVGRNDISHQAMATARRIWATMGGVAVEESLGRYFELQQREAAGQVQELELALKGVQEAEKERSDLWQQAAHDLRGNLGVVANATVGLTHRELREPVRDEFVRILMRNVTSLHHLLDDVTSLARLEAGKEKPRIEPIDVASVLYHLCEGIRPLAQQRHLFLRCDGPAAFATEGDAVKIRRIAQNLILNAVKYTHGGGITVSWGDSASNDPKRWLLRIKDTGPGLHTGANQLLTQALAERGDVAGHAIPEPRAAGDGTAGRLGERGEGIGLSIVKRLCELLNASIDMTSDEVTGTTFSICFPRRY